MYEVCRNDLQVVRSLVILGISYHKLTYYSMVLCRVSPGVSPIILEATYKVNFHFQV